MSKAVKNLTWVEWYINVTDIIIIIIIAVVIIIMDTYTMMTRVLYLQITVSVVHPCIKHAIELLRCSEQFLMFCSAVIGHSGRLLGCCSKEHTNKSVWDSGLLDMAQVLQRKSVAFFQSLEKVTAHLSSTKCMISDSTQGQVTCWSLTLSDLFKWE